MNMNKLILMILLLQPTMMNPAHAAKMAKVVVESAPAGTPEIGWMLSSPLLTNTLAASLV